MFLKFWIKNKSLISSLPSTNQLIPTPCPRRLAGVTFYYCFWLLFYDSRIDFLVICLCCFYSFVTVFEKCLVYCVQTHTCTHAHTHKHRNASGNLAWHMWYIIPPHVQPFYSVVRYLRVCLLHSDIKCPTVSSFWHGPWSDPRGRDHPYRQNLPGCDGEKHHHDAHRRLWWRAALPERENEQVWLHVFYTWLTSSYFILQEVLNKNLYQLIFSVEAIGVWRWTQGAG